MPLNCKSGSTSLPLRLESIRRGRDLAFPHARFALRAIVWEALPVFIRRVLPLGAALITAFIVVSPAVAERSPVGNASPHAKQQVCSNIVAQAIGIKDLKLVGIVTQAHHCTR